MQVVVILKEIDYSYDGWNSTEVYGVYSDLKSFYDEIKDKGYAYSENDSCWYTENEFGYLVYFREVVKTINGV